MERGSLPASPVLHTIDGNWTKEPLAEFRGMTIREAFAMHALAAALSNPGLTALISHGDDTAHFEAPAVVSVLGYVDEMLAELAK